MSDFMRYKILNVHNTVYTLRNEVGLSSPQERIIYYPNRWPKHPLLLFLDKGSLSKTGGVSPILTNPAAEEDFPVTSFVNKVACTALKSTLFLRVQTV